MSTPSILDRLPFAPPLRTARMLGERAAAAGFDWPDRAGVIDKIDEERAELTAALASGSHDAIEAEIGDVLFSLVNLCRHVGVDPEAALERTNAEFERRFRQVESSLKAEGHSVEQTSLEELERRWQAAKRRR
jgi:ATP diphosphatase